MPSRVERMTMERDNPGDSRVLFGTRSGRSARLVAIVGIAIGALTTLIGFISFVFAITGEGEVMLVGWLSLVWGVAPVAAGVVALRSLRAATGIAAVPVALGLVLAGILWDGDSSGAVVLGGIATAPPAVVLAVCL